MSIGASVILSAVLIGVGATLAMDLWNLLLKRALGIASLNYCLLGRWLRHMSAGTFRHARIAAAPPKSFECAAGWVGHYTIGVALAVLFVAVSSADWLARPTLPPALLYGIGTVVFPLFVMQPSLGLGVAASKTPNPMQARVKSLATHTIFWSRALRVCAGPELRPSSIFRSSGLNVAKGSGNTTKASNFEDELRFIALLTSWM